MEDIEWIIVEELETRSKEKLESHIPPWKGHDEVLPREYLTEDNKSEVKDYSAKENCNESANIVYKYLFSGHPKMQYSFEIGGSINSE